jgi:hypothetical protein
LLIKKTEDCFWKKRNKQKTGRKMYYDNTRIKRTKIAFLGIPIFVKDIILEIKKEEIYL